MVIGIIGILAMVGMVSLCLTMFFRNYADPAVLTAIIASTSAAIGSLGTILSKTGQPPIGGPPSTPVTVTNTPSDPVPVETQ